MTMEPVMAALLAAGPFGSWHEAFEALPTGDRNCIRDQGDLVEGYFAYQRALLDDAAIAVAGERRISRRVRSLVLAWLENISRDGEALLRSGLGVLTLRPGLLAGILWKTADHIWAIVGDRQGGASWYSKRGILASILMASLLHQNSGARKDDLTAFVDRRFAAVERIARLKSRLRG